MKNFIIFGASRGLGEAFVKGLPDTGDSVWMVSRSCPDSLKRNDGIYKYWIEADLSKSDASNRIEETLNGVKIDVLIYNVGIWERKGFRADYDFEQDDPDEIATQIPYEEGIEKVLSAYNGTQIPLQDIVSLVKCVMNLSRASCVKEINILAMLDTNA